MQLALSQDRLVVVFRAFCLVLPPLSLLSSQAVVPWLLIVAVAACAVVWRTDRWLPFPDRTVAMGFAALLLWSAAASLIRVSAIIRWRSGEGIVSSRVSIAVSKWTKALRYSPST